jgi:hypothetical protein
MNPSTPVIFGNAAEARLIPPAPYTAIVPTEVGSDVMLCFYLSLFFFLVSTITDGVK